MITEDVRRWTRIVLPRPKFEAMVCLMGLLYLLDIVPREYMMWPQCEEESYGNYR